MVGYGLRHAALSLSSHFAHTGYVLDRTSTRRENGDTARHCQKVQNSSPLAPARVLTRLLHATAAVDYEFEVGMQRGLWPASIRISGVENSVSD